MRSLAAAALALAGLGAVFSCVDERPAPPRDLPPAGMAGERNDGPQLGDAAVEPTGPCGDQRIPAIEDPPNLSFVIDRSASMGDPLAGSDFSKYENARLALARVLRAVGHRVSYGATIFPGLDGATGCQPGQRLMRMGPGDAPSYARENKTGPRLRSLLDGLSIADVDGGTPVAATLEAMLPVLTELEGQTYVVLLTDGAPNCNEELRCGASRCIPNIERLAVQGIPCTDEHNCCQPTATNPLAQRSCVDDDASVAAVAALADAGIGTFVLGMPGSEPYVNLLNALAEVGGTARDAPLKYYPVEDVDELEASLRAITASVSISCEIALDYEPPDADYVNVYFDDELVELDPVDGWEWVDSAHVGIRGAACERLLAGDVLEVQILAGCKTEVK